MAVKLFEGMLLASDFDGTFVPGNGRVTPTAACAPTRTALLLM